MSFEGMEQALATFVAESRELLTQMEGMLLRLEHETPDADTINALFRAAHTIKGSAGLFGLDGIVAFTHVAESVLDRVRAGKLALDGELAALFLECGDHVGKLVDAVAAGAETDAATHAAGERLLARLRAHLGMEAAGEAVDAQNQMTGRTSEASRATESARGPRPDPIGEAATGPSLARGPRLCPVGDDGLHAATDGWHISLRFEPEVLRHGLDPLAFIRYLTTFGEITRMVVVTDALPTPEEVDPESCYLGFEIGFKTSADKRTIEGAFEFVRDDCRLRILPPHSLVADYVRLMQESPEKDTRLGELLVQYGTLTRHELEEALRIQRQDAAAGAAARRIGDILVAEKLVRAPVVEAGLAKQTVIRDQKAVEARSLRVDADKLDRLIDLIGELIIAGASTNLIASRAGLVELLESASVLSRLVEDVRDSALKLRMVQIGATFSRFHRVVRDVAKELGKDIRLEISGAETELDKTLIEKIGDPLMHLVRNAMDHGIEEASARAAAGKPAAGTVRLNAYHDSGSIVIEVGDDGGGLKRERILKKAVERGLVESGQTLGDREIYRLVFEPGFSTAEQVTGLSGRGVGMDVVKRNVAALRGSVEIESTEGAGTTVRIRLPLTLAIIDGFLVRVGSSAFVIPLDMVEECIEIADTTGGHRYLNLRGQVLPYIRLRELFEVGGKAGRRESVVVVHDAGRKAGLVVDELLGEFQTVIKPLCRLFAQLRGIGGSTILGSGQVALILDVPALLLRTQEREAAGAAAPVRQAVGG